MKKRDMETRKPELLKQAIDSLTYMDLQGLFTNNGIFIGGFEAIDLQDSEIDEFHFAISMKEIYIKSCFCLQLGVNFYLLLHKRENATDYIYVREYKANIEKETAELISDNKYNEKSFIENWWDPRSCKHMQTKAYREDMLECLKNSYFDKLLDSYKRSWTFNIDGFIFDPLKKNKILAIIENRISNELAIEYYNPAKYFNKDQKVWQALKATADKLKVPLMLCTYSRQKRSESKMGVGVIKDTNGRLDFIDNITPNNNLFGSISQFKRWLIEYGAPDSIFTDNN